MSRLKVPISLRVTSILLFLVLAGHVLIEAKQFFLPICMAILIAYLIFPITSFFERFIPRIFANLLGIFLSIGILWAIFYLIFLQMKIFVDDFPQMMRQALSNVTNLELYVEELTGIQANQQESWMRDRVKDLFSSGSSFFKNTFRATIGTVANIGLMPVFVFFVLYYRNKFKEFILRIVPQHAHDKAEFILDDISLVTKKYMGGLFIVVSILCVTNSLGLYMIGLDHAILLGVLSALCNILPYFGTLIGGAIPLLYAILTKDSLSPAAGVIILFIFIQFLENNILTPNITGGNVRLNPFLTILVIIVGGLVWGVGGMFLSVPVVAIIKIICDHIDSLRPYGYLLGAEGTEEHAITWNKIVNAFKKFKAQKD